MDPVVGSFMQTSKPVAASASPGVVEPRGITRVSGAATTWTGTVPADATTGRTAVRSRKRSAGATLHLQIVPRFDDARSYSSPAAVVRTTRNLASPLIIRAYASAARSSGNSSFLDRTPES